MLPAGNISYGRTSQLILVFSPSDVCPCFVWLTVEAWLVRKTLGLLVPLFAARHKNAGSAGRMRDQRVQAVPGAQVALLPPAKSGWHTYPATWTSVSASS